MKKKVFYQTSFILLFILVLFLAFLIVDIYAIISFLFTEKNTFEYLGLIACICLGPCLVYTIIRFARNRIVFKEDLIFVPENWGETWRRDKDCKYQHETKIKYSEIENIFIITSDNNSLNQPLKHPTLPMPYIIFDLVNGEQKAINIFYYSKKSVVKIIDEAITRAAVSQNIMVDKSGEKILNDFLLSIKKK